MVVWLFSHRRKIIVMSGLIVDHWMEYSNAVGSPAPPFSVKQVELLALFCVGFLFKGYHEVGNLAIAILRQAIQPVNEIKDWEANDTTVYILLPMDSLVSLNYIV